MVPEIYLFSPYIPSQLKKGKPYFLPSPRYRMIS
jgi:hypothetical protein